jgi:AAA family ATP:ADP antiporter
MKDFSKIVPIRREEWPKFLLTAAMMVLTLYIYSILRGTKDSLIISEIGAEMLSALKLWGVLPSAILIMLIYTKLADHFSRIKIYHMLNGFFVGYFVLFNFVIYPNVTSFHFDFNDLVIQYPKLKYIILMFGNWSFSLFYIFAELWGSVMLSLMFWQLANQINSVEEAKRFYPLLGFLAQAGLLASGILMGVFSKADSFDESLNYICMTVLVSGIMLSFALHILAEQIVGKEVINGAAIKKKKEKMGLVASLQYIAASRYIRLITLLILCYGVSINLVEGVWKGQVKLLYPSKNEISAFMGQVQTYTAIASFIAMLTGSIMLRMFSWRFNASATPAIILFTGVPFFIFVIYRDIISDYVGIAATDVLFTAVLFGAVQNVLSKAVKYSFFDPTKEMAYIPLDEQLKAKGKAAADVVGGRLGKSGGAFITFLMLTVISGSDLVSLAPSFAVIFTIIMVIWFYAALALSKEFVKINK